MKKLASLFKGAAVALITPFDDKGKIDISCLHRLVEKQIEGGTAAIVSCGTTGEPATLSLEERITVIRETIKAVKGRIPVICGTGANCTATVIENEHRMRDLGCAAQLVVTPYYNRATQEGMYRHFSTIAEQTELPIILYNVPSRTNVDLSAATLQRLCGCEKIIGLKESSYNLPDIMRKMALCSDSIDFYSGNDDLVYPFLTLGAKGVISAVSNLYPKQMSALTEAYFSGRLQEARDRQWKLLPLIQALFHEVSPIPVKYAMEQAGLCSGTLRLPLCEAQEETKQMLRQAMADLEA